MYDFEDSMTVVTDLEAHEHTVLMEEASGQYRADEVRRVIDPTHPKWAELVGYLADQDEAYRR